MIDRKKIQFLDKDTLEKILNLKEPELIKSSLSEYGLEIVNKKIVPTNQYRKIYEETQAYWDKKQLVKKINLNSAYGALLNAGSRFFDQRLGQSTTLTGRTITKYMASKTNEIITGMYDHYGDAVLYEDTDSCYFTAYPILKDEIDRGEIDWSKESVITLYNNIAKEVSSTFPEYLKQTLNIPINRSTGVIASSRETVSQTALWITKKRYACLMIDKDNIRLDVNGKPGKIKAMGLDLKRSDTPKFIQEFLSEILMDTLCDKGEKEIIEKIRNFKIKFKKMKPWEQGTPKAVNKLTHYRELEEASMKKMLKGKESKKVTMPGHVRASLAWNKLRDLNNDNHSMKIIDGQKIIVCKLKETAENTFTSIAYPIDEPHLPKWFTELPFDSDDMLGSVVDKKIENLLGVLGWDLNKTDTRYDKINKIFKFKKDLVTKT